MKEAGFSKLAEWYKNRHSMPGVSPIGSVLADLRFTWDGLLDTAASALGNVNPPLPIPTLMSAVTALAGGPKSSGDLNKGSAESWVTNFINDPSGFFDLDVGDLSNAINQLTKELLDSFDQIVTNNLSGLAKQIALRLAARLIPGAGLLFTFISIIDAISLIIKDAEGYEKAGEDLIAVVSSALFDGDCLKTAELLYTALINMILS